QSGRKDLSGRGSARRRRLRMQGQRPQQHRRGLEEEHQHGAAPGRDRRVTAALGADDEIAGGAFAFVVDQRAFEHERLLEILVLVRRNAGARLELRQNGQHPARRIVIDHLDLLPRRILDPRQRLGLDEARRKRAERSCFSHGFLLLFGVSLCAGEEAVHEIHAALVPRSCCARAQFPPCAAARSDGGQLTFGCNGDDSVVSSGHRSAGLGFLRAFVGFEGRIGRQTSLLCSLLLIALTIAVLVALIATYGVDYGKTPEETRVWTLWSLAIELVFLYP